MERRMSFMKNKNLNYYITKYFSDYLPLVLGVSKNTISSYRDTFVLLLKFIQIKNEVNINNISLSYLTNEIIEEFLIYLETEHNNSISTRNQRLAVIRSFCKYLKNRELSCFENCSNILSIPIKKAPKTSLSYFSVDEIEILVNMPNSKTKNGFRNYVLLLFMYETAARAQEIADLTLKQIHFKDYSYVILKGKGNKERNIPITEDLKEVLIKYIKIFHIEDQDDYIFKNKNNNKITTKGIEYILKKYIEEARIKYPNKFKDNFSNHSMRHSRAMHLLEAGVNLIYIRDILGHKSVITTEIYAKTNPLIKEKQIIEHSKHLNVEDKYSEEDKNNLLEFLNTL